MYLNALQAEQTLVLHPSGAVSPSPLGRSLSRSRIRLDTLELFNGDGTASLAEPSKLLELVCRSRELDEICFGAGDKALLYPIIRDSRLQFPLAKGRLCDNWHKTFLLVQIGLQGNMQDCESKLPPSLRADLNLAISQACRVLDCTQIMRHIC